MRIKSFISLSLFLLVSSANFSFPFQDSDLDGVEDSVDLCPNTPILALVDKYGCPIEEEYRELYERKRKRKVKFYLKFGFSHSKDKNYESNSLSLSFALSRRPFYLSITSRYYTYTSFGGKGLGDASLYGSYTRRFRSFLVIPGLRVKLPTGEEDVSTRRVDLTPSVVLNLIRDRWDIFLYVSYSIRAGRDRKNVFFYSFGGGYSFSDRLYGNVSLDLSESTLRDEYNTYASFFLVYDITKRFYATLNYSRGLSENATDNALSVRFGIRF